VTVWHPRCHALLSVVLDGRGAPDSGPLLVETTPRSATVSRNGYHDADTWSLEFDARALPFDPEIVSGAAAFIYMFNSSSLDDRREWAVPGFEMVRGIADDAFLEMSEDGMVFRLEGRDYTSLLSDPEWDPRDRIPFGESLDKTIQELADAAAPPGTRARFEVVFDSDFHSPPRVGASQRKTKRKGLWVKPGTSYWQVIYDLALSHGFIAYVQGEQIIITDPETQTRQSLERAPRLVYGRNLMSLSCERKLTKERVPQIKIVGYDPATGKRVEVVYPERSDKVTTGLGTKRDEVMLLPAPRGVSDRETLKRVARSRYMGMARSETTYHAETMDLESLDGQDLLRLQAGSPIALQFDAFNRETMRSLSVSERVAHLEIMGYPPKVSAFVADHFDRVDQFRQAHYGQTFTYHFGADDGLRIEIDAQNYAYEPREQSREELAA